MDYRKARSTCLSEGGALTTVNRPETKEFLRQKYGRVSEMWLSVNSFKGDDYRWEFADGSTECVSNETSNWNPGEPSGGNEKCVIMKNGDKWADVNCGSTFPFLCQIINDTHQGVYTVSLRIAD